MSAKIHPTAVIDPSAEFAADVEIGPGCVIGPNVKLGARSRLIAHVFIESHTELGEDNTVFPFAGLEGTPVAEDGFLYLTTGWGVVTKLDTRGGVPRMVWQHDPTPDRDYATTVACCGINNRGAVLAGNMVISIVIDGRVLALNKTDGSVIWEAQVADPGQGETFTGAPLIVKDMVVTGMAGRPLK